MTYNKGNGKGFGKKKKSNNQGKNKGSSGDKKQDGGNKKTTTKLMKFTLQSKDVNNVNAGTFAEVKRYMINKIQSQFTPHGCDIAETLENESKKNLNSLKPKLDSSKAKDDETKQRENRQFDLDYQEENKNYKRRVAILEDNLPRAFSTIWDEYCTESLKKDLLTIDDFETRIKNNPIELLKAIRGTTFETARQLQPYHSAVLDYKRLAQIQQLDGESAMGLKDRVKEMVTRFQQQWGKDCIHDLVKKTKEYKSATAAQQAVLLDEGFDRFMADLYLEAANMVHYFKT
jgi:hypothetical protein